MSPPQKKKSAPAAARSSAKKSAVRKRAVQKTAVRKKAAAKKAAAAKPFQPRSPRRDDGRERRWQWSDASRAQISNSAVQTWQDPTVRARRIAGIRRAMQTPEVRARIEARGKARRGRKHSPATIDKMRAAALRYHERVGHQPGGKRAAQKAARAAARQAAQQAAKPAAARKRAAKKRSA